MEKKPEPAKPVLWDIYVSIGGAERGHVGMLVGTVEAADENEAIGKAPARLKQYGPKLMAVRQDLTRARSERDAVNRESPNVRAYRGLHLPRTHCIHFVNTREFDQSVGEVVEAAVKTGVKLVHWDYLDGGGTSTTIADPLGRALQLQHAPYGGSPLSSWVPFLDDLITLAYRYPGLVIVIDHANILLRERPDDMFDLIEAFLTVFHHWYDQKKPCHLCFQMEQNDSVRRVFVREDDSC